MNDFNEVNAVTQLAQKLGENWPSIFEAQTACQNHTEKIRGLVNLEKQPPNTSVVAFGSLARNEWTSGSDVDWTLMIDGPTDMHHFDVAKGVENRLAEAGYLEPGPTGTFGSMSSSHELVHHIGGGEDTNQNITRRVLLLLESVSLSDQVTHERVVRAILERYIVGDLPATSKPQFRVPLFLLNDVVRFWRTMAVDYATKKWQRSAEGWALRNTKLRMSRKLLFTKGLLMCFLCHSEFAGTPTSNDPEIVSLELLNLCFNLARKPAIQLVAEVLIQHSTNETASQIMRAYEVFLGTLNDVQKRNHLKNLPFSMSDNTDDLVFNEQRQNSRDFRDGLEQLFFKTHPHLTELTQRYGIF